MALDEHYICQRAANAIISEIGPFRVSTDSLQIINQFLDEFVLLLLGESLSLDLSEIKLTIFKLLPSSTLGKNAIVEAELEVKTFTESQSVDYEVYETMRQIDKTVFPLEKAVLLLKEKCFEYCTLADKEDQVHLQKIQEQNNNDLSIVISPIVAIYVTTIIEHVAEYLLTAVAIAAQNEETDYVRVREVYLALLDDVQLGNVFSKMKLKERMEIRKTYEILKKRTLQNKNRFSFIPNQPPVVNNNNRKSYSSTNNTDKDFDFFDENIRKSQSSASSVRPYSGLSHSSAGSRRSSIYHVFKNNRNSFSNLELPSRSGSPVLSVFDPENVPTMDFEELVKSGGTVKVSLTPNRLRSIEIKDQTKEDPVPDTTWKRSSASSHRLSGTSSLSRRLSRQSTLSNISQKVDSIKSMLPKSPASPLSKKSFTGTERHSRFENPRKAPKPPSTIEVASAKKSPGKAFSIVSSISSSLKSPKKSDTPSLYKNSVTDTPSATETASIFSSPVIEARDDPEKINTPERQVQFTKESVKPRPERPSSMAAKRVSMIAGNKFTIETNNNNNKAMRHRSMYENYSPIEQEPGSVSVSIKQWDLKSEDTFARSMRSSSVSSNTSRPELGTITRQNSNAVLDKVLKFERASSLDDPVAQRVSNLPRRERFLYLQRDPSSIERKTAIRTNSRPRGVDQAIQTDLIKKEDQESGLMDGDEEWFLQDDEWDEQEETAIVQWLLGE